MGRVNAAVCIVILASILSACTSYKSSFSCPSSKGAHCMPMDMVDNMISNGQIEEYNEKHRKRNCNKSRCYQHVIGKHK